MTSDGKKLEALVAFVEETLLPHGFTVKVNKREYDAGKQIAEFDVLVEGQVGTANFRWLIECRDRPAEGPAPGAWIEQLVGRRDRFRFNKVTAVSTTGFSEGAADFARAQDIELRDVRDASPDDFTGWLGLRFIGSTTMMTSLRSIRYVIAKETPAEQIGALKELLPTISRGSPVLRSSSSGNLVTPAEAFRGAANEAHDDLCAGLAPGEEPRVVALRAEYVPDDHFLIDTAAGPVEISAIEFVGEGRLEERQLPVISSNEYRGVQDGAAISQVVSFAPVSVSGQKVTFEMHHLAKTGETHVLLRRISDGS